MRGNGDKAMIISARTMGWDPNEIVGDTYDASMGPIPKDRIGPDTQGKTVNEIKVSMQQAPEPHNYAGPAKYSDAERHYPGKPR